MRFKLTPSFNDGKNDAPPHEVEVPSIDRLLDYAHDELHNDNNEVLGVGFTLTIERVA